jgi:hypothetical protein
MSSETIEATNNEKATDNDENVAIINKGELNFEKIHEIYLFIYL